ncbi:hypothetical protein [Acinetobacter phage vB_AbM_WUPSU]|nr:hypothetical protein [Acinetobacter phage vB_AbM_WUPSU]
MNSFNSWYYDLLETRNGSRLNQQEIAEEAWTESWDRQQVKINKTVDFVMKLKKSADNMAEDHYYNEILNMLRGNDE